MDEPAIFRELSSGTVPGHGGVRHGQGQSLGMEALDAAWSADAEGRRRTYAHEMPRRARMLLPDIGSYHVTCRGVARQEIYRDDDDRTLFCALLRLATRRWRWHVLAYCLMPNHFHIVVTCDLERLSRGMHLLNFRYAQSFNHRHGRAGHLFQGRFSSYVIASDEHFVAACAYVIDNPVRAGLCSARDDWPWLGGEILGDLRWRDSRGG